VCAWDLRRTIQVVVRCPREMLLMPAQVSRFKKRPRSFIRVGTPKVLILASAYLIRCLEVYQENILIVDFMDQIIIKKRS